MRNDWDPYPSKEAAMAAAQTMSLFDHSDNYMVFHHRTKNEWYVGWYKGYVWTEKLGSVFYGNRIKVVCEYQKGEPTT